MNRTLFLIAPALASSAAMANDLKLTIEIPKIDAKEYHRPYVAAWIEKPDQSHAANLAVWYEAKNEKGESWLKDLRQWWRKSGRSVKMPLDGISGPTRPVGKHTLDIPEKSAPLPPLAEGEYTLVVEAAREVGGRETVRIPFKWDGKTAVDASGTGKTELGQIQLLIATKS